MVETFRTGKIEGFVGFAVGLAFGLAVVGFGLWVAIAVLFVDRGEATLGRLLVALFGIAMFAAGAFGLRYLLTTCFRVQVWDDGTCEFRSALHRTRVHALEIVSIKGVRDAYGDINAAKIVTRQGKLRLEEPFDGFAPFLARLKELNANITVSFPSGYLKGAGRY